MSEISKCWIGTGNQREFFSPVQIFDLLLSNDGLHGSLGDFVVKQLGEFVFAGEYGSFAFFVFADSAGQIIGDAGVEGGARIAHDIHGELFFRVGLHVWREGNPLQFS